VEAVSVQRRRLNRTARVQTLIALAAKSGIQSAGVIYGFRPVRKKKAREKQRQTQIQLGAMQ
jgi:hypothetical protein